MRPITTLPAEPRRPVERQPGTLAFVSTAAVPTGLWEVSVLLDDGDTVADWRFQTRPERAVAPPEDPGGTWDAYRTRFEVPAPSQALSWATYGPMRNHPQRITHAAVAAWIRQALAGTVLVAPQAHLHAGRLVHYVRRHSLPDSGPAQIGLAGVMDLDALLAGVQYGMNIGRPAAAARQRVTLPFSARDRGFGHVQPLGRDADTTTEAQWAYELFQMITTGGS